MVVSSVYYFMSRKERKERKERNVGSS
jgi:preprotein translocase subunit YajC